MSMTGSVGKSGPGASSAMEVPFTPIAFHAAFARVGPTSGPPCFFGATHEGGGHLIRLVRPCLSPGPAARGHKVIECFPHRQMGALGLGKGKNRGRTHAEAPQG